MFDKASLKLGLDKAVLKSMRNADQATPVSQFSKKEVEDLLKRGAYGAVMDDSNEADQFCEEDIDAILKRRTQVIQIESEGKGSTFSKVPWHASVAKLNLFSGKKTSILSISMYFKLVLLLHCRLASVCLPIDPILI